jgi:hypothetical protein
MDESDTDLYIPWNNCYMPPPQEFIHLNTSATPAPDHQNSPEESEMQILHRHYSNLTLVGQHTPDMETTGINEGYLKMIPSGEYMQDPILPQDDPEELVDDVFPPQGYQEPRTAMKVPNSHTETAASGIESQPSFPIKISETAPSKQSEGCLENIVERKPTLNKVAAQMCPEIFYYDPCYDEFLKSLTPLWIPPLPNIPTFVQKDRRETIRSLRAGYHKFSHRKLLHNKTKSLQYLMDGNEPLPESAPQRSTSLEIIKSNEANSNQLNITPLNNSLIEMIGAISSMTNIAGKYRSPTYTEVQAFIKSHPHVSTDMFRNLYPIAAPGSVVVDETKI